MSPGLNSLATSEECMIDKVRERYIKMSVSCQQLNMAGIVLWCGVPFQPQEQVTWWHHGYESIPQHSGEAQNTIWESSYWAWIYFPRGHSSNYCRNYLRQKESAETLKMMDWPPQSTDLNPIEQIWGELENKLDRSIVHSKESLWLEFQKAWDHLSVEVFRKYIDTMPERCAAVIDAKGGHT